MKKLAVYALAVVLALSSLAALAEPVEEIWSATVLRAEAEALWLRVDAVDPEDAVFPEDAPEAEPEAEPEPEPAAGEAPGAARSVSEETEDESPAGVQLVRLAETVEIWRREGDAFVGAAPEEIAEGDALWLRVIDGEALEIVIVESAGAGEVKPLDG